MLQLAKTETLIKLYDTAEHSDRSETYKTCHQHMLHRKKTNTDVLQESDLRTTSDRPWQ